MSALNFPSHRKFDLACLGRVAVDLYAEQFGCRLEDATSFSKTLGGSSGNLAFGVARLGLRSAMISRVGNEQMGRFLTETLEREGCDTSQVQIDPERLTALVLLGLKDRDTFPLLFVRENCADMAVDAALIREDFIAQCRALAITGTHLSTPGTRAASLAALGYAGKHGVVRVLDIDYRPVLWGLTGRGEGENRFVADATVTQQLQDVLPQFELLVGTEEEFLIAGGVPDDLEASLRAVRAITPAVFVVKRGAAGCAVIEGAVPASIDDAPTYQGERVEVLNVLGAGDAFLSGLMAGLLRGHDWARTTQIANACGAIVVSRHACSAAMPTMAELDHWFSGSRNPKVDADAQLAHLHRVSVKRAAWPEVCVMAFDHRAQFLDMAREAGASESRIPALKQLLVRAAEQAEIDHGLKGKFGVLIDGSSYGVDALPQATGRGWWVGRPIELPGSRPLRFDGGVSVATTLKNWPPSHVVKCLVHYHPGRRTRAARRAGSPRGRAVGRDAHLRARAAAGAHPAQGRVGCRPRGRRAACRVPLLQPRLQAGVVEAGAAVFSGLAGAGRAGGRARSVLPRRRHPRLEPAPGRSGTGLRAGPATPIVKGFMVGRTLWAEPSLQWLQGTLDDAGFVAAVSHNFTALVQAWNQSRGSVAPARAAA